MRTISHPVGPSLFLVCQPVASAVPAVTADAPVDLVLVADVSGSMSYQLPELKRQVKNLLPRVLRPGDTFSLIYFSGPGQCAVLVDQAAVREGGSRLADIAALHETIDQLGTIGLTCFVDPLSLLADFGAKLCTARPRSRRAVIFGSDGYDNTSPGSTASARRKAILDAVDRAMGSGIDRFTALGTGYCCDQALLQDMAAAAGGAFMFSDDVSRYARDIEAAASRRPSGVRRKQVALDGGAVDGVAFSVEADGTVAQYAVEDGSLLVPESVPAVWYLSERKVRSDGAQVSLASLGGSEPYVAATYAALALFSQRCRRKVVRALAHGIGDARLVRQALGCFGPQRYNALADEALAAVREPGRRFAEGRVSCAAPDPNAYTVLDALRALQGEGNRIYPSYPGWEYKPVTRGRVPSAGVLTAEEAKEVAGAMADLTAKLSAGTAVEDLDALRAKLDALRKGKGPKVRYEYLWAEAGYPVDGLVYGSEEANVSVRIRRPIALDLTEALADLPEGLRGKVPTSFPSSRYTTYTVVTGRVLNVPALPVILSAATWAEFSRHGLVSGPYEDRPVLLNLASLPIVNDAMVEGLSAAEVVRTAYRLEEVKAALKVVNEARKQHLPERGQSGVAEWVARAGLSEDDAAAVLEWLGKLGVTDGGYQPPSAAAAKSGDQRRSWVLDVGIPGLSSLPPVGKVREKLAKLADYKAVPKGKEPKLTRSEALLAPHVRDLDAYLASHKVDLANLDDAGRAVLGVYVEVEREGLEPERRELLHKLSGYAITAICGGEWFGDLRPGETTLEVELGGERVACTVDVRDVDVDL